MNVSIYRCFMVFCLLVTPLQAAELKPLNWSQLLPTLAPVDDPFERLSQSQLDDLGYYAGLKNDIQITRAAESDHHSLAEREAELQGLAAALAQQGVDVEAILRQRQPIIEYRMAKAIQPSQQHLGEPVQLSGYIVPLKYSSEQQGVTRLFLLPVNPLASIGHDHSVPQPNQVVMIELEQGASAIDFQRRYSVSGVLQAQFYRQQVTMPDGHKQLIESSYRLQPAASQQLVITRLD
ncbi:hypothetical protein SIN8267_02073 [Sinobacterium norvegicum]|uniref:DUF3299 domain-containing protein n=1 Tax=Sinobacterium norvegicum TaxID=1641715 RepID=A0ABN8EJV6_9GAMM|nr:DUF3299 domain-containing protein [Sinobacterium norvegicum]CAH0991958.1 hypothetical protein SIN8267_02073 [Sinobacterium norvegicum]